jgi:hypothetical protein
MATKKSQHIHFIVVMSRFYLLCLISIFFLYVFARVYCAFLLGGFLAPPIWWHCFTIRIHSFLRSLVRFQGYDDRIDDCLVRIVLDRGYQGETRTQKLTDKSVSFVEGIIKRERMMRVDCKRQNWTDLYAAERNKPVTVRKGCIFSAFWDGHSVLWVALIDHSHSYDDDWTGFLLCIRIERSNGVAIPSILYAQKYVFSRIYLW